MYNELKAGLQALKANVQSDSAKQAVQSVVDSLEPYLESQRQQDGQQLAEKSWDVANTIMFNLAQQMNGDQTFYDFLYGIGVEIKQLRRQQFPYEAYAHNLNEVFVKCNKGLYKHLSGGC